MRGAEDVAVVTDLVWEFFEDLKTSFPRDRATLDGYLTAHDVATELAELPRHFNPPHGECLLGTVGGAPAGTLMMKRIDAQLCEINRMYVRHAARGKGLARALCLAMMDAARAMGFTRMRLETLNPDIPALPLYRSLGFLPDPEPTDYARANPTIVSLRRAL